MAENQDGSRNQGWIMGFFNKLFSNYKKTSTEKIFKDKASSAIIEFEKEISTWPLEQAQLGIEMLRALELGEFSENPKKFGGIKNKYFNFVFEIFKKTLKERGIDPDNLPDE